jgi:hypothetical protein
MAAEAACGCSDVGDTSFLFEMGFDNVKIDSCSEFRDLSLWEHLLNETGRAYIIEDCFQGGIVGNLSWCPFTHFRTGGDLSQGWNDIANKLQQVRPYTRNITTPTSRPGCWAFPDMLQVGQVSPNTQEANQAHFGAWSIVSSPLILGMNLSDETAMNTSWPIIMNKEVVDVNQQWAGHPGKLVREWFPSPGEDGPANGSFAWAMPCDGAATQTGWNVYVSVQQLFARSAALTVRTAGAGTQGRDKPCRQAWTTLPGEVFG